MCCFIVNTANLACIRLEKWKDCTNSALAVYLILKSPLWVVCGSAASNKLKSLGELPKIRLNARTRKPESYRRYQITSTELVYFGKFAWEPLSSLKRNSLPNEALHMGIVRMLRNVFLEGFLCVGRGEGGMRARKFPELSMIYKQSPIIIWTLSTAGFHSALAALMAK